MRPFHYNGHPARVIFGSGTISQLPDEVARLGLERVLVLATPPQEAEANRIAALLGNASAGVFAGAVMHTPVSVTEQALAVVAERGADGVVAIGGGSTTGLGKAIALRTDLPQIVVPTTYAGSEMTPILGETKDNTKTTQSSPKVLPEVVIYDVDLTMTLPAGLSGTSGINAIAHAVEALYAREANPIIDLMALEAIGALHRALPRIAKDPADRRPARMPSMAPGSAACAWAPSACRCITSSAIRSAARSTFRMPRPTPRSCPTPWPTTHRQFRRSSSDCGARSEPIPRARFSISPARSAPNARCAGSECPRRASTSQPNAPLRTPTGTRARSSATRCAPSSRAPMPARDRRTADKSGGKAVSKTATPRKYPLFQEETSVEVVNARMGDDIDPRLREVTGALVKHLHAFIKEVEPTHEEWLKGIEFLTAVGQMCNEWRQEYILLSDILGVSMLVDAINHRRPSGATENTILGPFYVPEAPRYAPGANICLDGRAS